MNLSEQSPRLGSKIVVFGASGQLGQCLAKVARERNIQDILFLPEERADILDKDMLEEVLAEEMPLYVINCAAYTAVDRAEDEPDVARRVNRDGAANLAEVCRAHQTTLIHISTDFVFNGSEPKLLDEQDSTSPLSIYGLTKLQGEVAISGITNKYFILRTSWLYSEFANNFVKTMRRLGAERGAVSVVADQVGNPTYAVDLARTIFEIIDSRSDKYGVYHYSNEGLTSWYDFAQAIFEMSGIEVQLRPLKTSEYPTKAERPAFSAMDKSKLKKEFGVDIPYWRDSLRKCIETLNSSNNN